MTKSDHWGYSFVAKRTGATECPEPVQECLGLLSAASSKQDVLKQLWPSDHFSGVETEDKLYDTVHALLDKLVEDDSRTHRTMCNDVNFSQRRHFPTVYRHAAERVS